MFLAAVINTTDVLADNPRIVRNTTCPLNFSLYLTIHIVQSAFRLVTYMARTSFTKPELQIMEVLWTRGACSIREIHEAIPPKGRPAFTTVQTVVYRLEKKRALRCVKRVYLKTRCA